MRKALLRGPGAPQGILVPRLAPGTGAPKGIIQEKDLQIEASLYGMSVNLNKTEILANAGSTPPIYFVDGTPASSSESIKYLVTWSNPTKKATDARKAHTRCMKLEATIPPLKRATKLKICH